MDMGSSTMNMAATTASGISGIVAGTASMPMSAATETAATMSTGGDCKISVSKRSGSIKEYDWKLRSVFEDALELVYSRLL
jgi:hypothetical protein